MFGLGEVRVTTQQHLSEAAAEANSQRSVDLLSRSLVRWSVPRAIDHAQDFGGIGEAEHQRMVTPCAVVGDIHATFAFTGRSHQSAVHVNGGLLEEGVRLSGPDLDADVIEDILERLYTRFGEAPAEVTCGGWIWDATSAEGIEEDFVVAAQFDVLQACAVAQSVVGEVENVIRLVEGQVDLEQMQAIVDSVDQTDLTNQEVNGADAAVADAATAIADLVVDVACREHGLAAITELGFVETPVDTTLAVGQFLG